MATTGFSSTKYHSVADHADFTLPNGNWFQLLICRPDDVTGGEDICSNGEYDTSNSLNYYINGNDFGLKVNSVSDQNVSNATTGNWFLLCAQRSGTTLTLRSVPMGSTTVGNSGAGATLNTAVNSGNSTYIGRRRDNGDAPFNGAVSDWLIVPGKTISNSDLQAIATGTAIDSFAWYSSATFWAILENSTNTDHIGGKTITENGALSSAIDSTDLVRFGAVEIGQISESNTVFGFNVLKARQINQVIESDTAQSVSPIIAASTGLVTETNLAQAFSGHKQAVIAQIIESDIAQSVNPIKPVSIAQVSETDAAQEMFTGTDVPISQVFETDIAQQVTPERILIGQVTETDQVQAFGHIIHQTINQVIETDLVQLFSAGAGINIDIVTETDQSQPFTPVKPIILPIGLITETDQALSAAVNSAIGLVTEISTVLSFTFKTFASVLPTNAGSNLYFIANNRIDDAATLTATSIAAGFDVDNLQLDQKTKVWRSTGLATQTITITWIDPENISAVGFAFSNLTRGANVRTKLYTNVADGTPVFDTGDKSVDYAYGPPKGFNTIGLVSFSYGGGTYFSSLFETVQIKKMEILLDNPTNPDGYIEISKIITGKAFTPTLGARYGAAVGHDDRTESIRTDAGDLVTNRDTMNKVLPFTLGVLYPDDRRELFEMIRRNGVANPVFLSLYENSSNPHERISHVIYGNLNGLPSVPIEHFNIYNSTVQITEV